MNPLPPFAIWGAAQREAEPEELVKFTLIYDGDLASAGNKSKPVEASNIRNVFHDQLADLWDSHVVMRQLRHTARVNNQLMGDLALIRVPATGTGFVPIVRRSLYLGCQVDVLFLRHEEPYSLMRQGGDLDGRIKTLFDALKMPDPKDPEYKGATPADDPLYVVLEDDALITDFSVKSGKLLGRGEKMKHRVRLTVDITIKVSRVFQQNQHLVGG